jgi:hypothetical protein
MNANKVMAIAAVAMIALVPIKAEAFMFGYMLGSMNGGGGRAARERAANAAIDIPPICIAQKTFGGYRDCRYSSARLLPYVTERGECWPKANNINKLCVEYVIEQEHNLLKRVCGDFLQKCQPEYVEPANDPK